MLDDGRMASKLVGKRVDLPTASCACARTRAWVQASAGVGEEGEDLAGANFTKQWNGYASCDLTE